MIAISTDTINMELDSQFLDFVIWSWILKQSAKEYPSSESTNYSIESTHT